VELVVQAASKCLFTISEQYNIPSALPPSMSAKFRIGSSLAAACQDLGYKGEIGYQTFLYANEHELRKVMMFLIEKLPKESGETIDEPLGKGVLLNRRIAAELKKQLSFPWTPAYCKKRNMMNSSNNNWFLQGTSSFNPVNTCQLQYPIGMSNPKKISKEDKEAFGQMKYICNQPINSRDLYASLAEENSCLVAKEREWEKEWNQSGIMSRLTEQEYKNQKRERLLKKIKEKLRYNVENETLSNVASGTKLNDLLDAMPGKNNQKSGKGSRFTHAEKLQFAPDEEVVAARTQQKKEEEEEAQQETEEERQQKREKEIDDLRNQLNELTERFENTQITIKQLTAQKQQMDEQSVKMETSNKDAENAYRVKKKTFDLLPESEENLNKLMQLVENSSQKLVTLNEQWEKHRAPLIQKYRELKEQSKNRQSEVETRIEQIRVLREKMKSVTDDTRDKEEMLKQLVSEYESLSKDVNRSSYTKRILDIVASIKKQREQIAKILLDTKTLQKDINFLTGKLDRTFTVTDELIFKDAKKNEFSRKAYKLLANLHETFGNLVQTVEETGLIMRETRDLEEQVDNINEDEIHQNLSKISKDLKQIKEENSEMISKLKSRK